MIKKIKNIIILVLLAVMLALISAGITILDKKNSVNAYAFDYGFDFGFGGPELPDGTELPSGPSGSSGNGGGESSETVIKLSDLFSYNQDVQFDSSLSSQKSVTSSFYDNTSNYAALFYVYNDLDTVYLRSVSSLQPYGISYSLISQTQATWGTSPSFGDGVDFQLLSGVFPKNYYFSCMVFVGKTDYNLGDNFTLYLDISVGGASAPTISYDSDDNLISWSMPDFNGVYYLYQDGVGVVQNSTATSYTPTENGRYNVMALGTGYIADSDYSDYVNVVIIPKLSAPVLSYNSSSRTLSWTETNRGGDYQLYNVTTDTIETETMYTSYIIKSYGVYKVRAIGDGETLDSDWSNEISVFPATDPIKLSAPVLSYNSSSNTLSWTETNSGGDYQVYNVTTDTIAKETNNITFNPIVSGVYKVRAIGDGFETLDSDWSNEISVTIDDLYFIGYNDGFTDGRQEGIVVGRVEGYQNGYEVGKNDGYTDAINNNLSSAGILAGAFAFTKLFFQLAGDFMSKPLAGDITIGLILIGLPATFFVLQGVISLILKLFGSNKNE